MNQIYIFKVSIFEMLIFLLSNLYDILLFDSFFHSTDLTHFFQI